MIHTDLSGSILSIDVDKLSEDGQQIIHGRYQFVSSEAREGKEEIKDEVEFRCKGKSAEEIKKSGLGSSGLAQGYWDFIIKDKGEYKEATATLVIRVWHSTAILEPNPFDEADAMLAQMEEDYSPEEEAYNPEEAPQPQETYRF